MSGQTSGRILRNMTSKGIFLPPAAPVAGNYRPFLISGHFLFISGQLPFDAHGLIAPAFTGKLGETVSTDDGRQAARTCALNILAQAQSALGTLDRIVRCIRLGGYISCTPHFSDLAHILNGASDLIVDCLGEAGRHTRAVTGAMQLPVNASVEVEAMFEISL